MQRIKDQLGEFAKDTKLNLSSVLTEEGSPGLSQKQIVLMALAAAYTLKNAQLKDALFEEHASLLTDEDVYGIKAAVSLMAMNNMYYRFIHLSEDPSLAKMPTKLRMNVMRDPKLSKLDFEMLCLGVSILNGCGMCITSHINSVKEHGFTGEALTSVARIVSVIHAVDQSIDLSKN